MEDGSEDSRDAGPDDDGERADAQPAEAVSDEDAHVQEYDGCFVQTHDDLVGGLREPEEEEAGTQGGGGKVVGVLAVAVDDGELDGDGEEDGEDLYNLAIDLRVFYVLLDSTHERCYDGVVVRLELKDAHPREHPRDNEQPCAKNHDQRRQIQLPPLILLPVRRKSHISRHICDAVDSHRRCNVFDYIT